MQAAYQDPDHGADPRENAATTASDFRADGGAAAETSPSADPEPADCGCLKLSDGFPCWPCYAAGLKDLPGEP